MEFEEAGSETESVRRHRLVSWKIGNIEERTRRSELEELEQSGRAMVFSLEEFAAPVIASRRNKRKEPVRYESHRDQRAAKALKDACRIITAGQVGR